MVIRTDNVKNLAERYDMKIKKELVNPKRWKPREISNQKENNMPHYLESKYLSEEMQKEDIISVSKQLHDCLSIQCRNLLFEYKYGCTDDASFKLRGHVPVEHVQKLMILYGDLIINLIIDKMIKSPFKELTHEIY